MLIVLLFLSGAASLIYQVVWLEDLSLVFGSTTVAAAIGLAVFFLGLGTGAHVWGARAATVSNGLRAFAWLELGIAACAAIVPFVFDAYRRVYPILAETAGSSVTALTLVRGGLAVVCLLPPTFLMGGTLPMVAQAIIHRPDRQLGTAGATLYAANTIGAAVGALAAGFVLPAAIGYEQTLLAAMGVNVVVGVVAWTTARGDGAAWLTRGFRLTTDAEVGSAGHRPSATGRSPRVGHGDARRSRQAAVGHDGHRDPSTRAGGIRPALSRTIAPLAAMSGLVTLGLEVLWVRMFAQVIDSSVYAFSTILVVVLASLAAGALIAARLSRLTVDSTSVLAGLLLTAGLAIVAQPLLFVWWTDGLVPLAMSPGQIAVSDVLGLGLAVLAGPGVLVGCIFPYLLKVAETQARPAGWLVGRLAAVNTAGAIVGSLATGFALVPAIGLWASLRVMGALYLVAAVLLTPMARMTVVARVVGVAAVVGSVAALHAAVPLPRVRLDATRGERLVEAWESSYGIVTLVESARGRQLKLDNTYSLGGTVDRIARERIQALLPLVLHPKPESVFFLGLGAGITAGEAVRHPVSRIVVCELVPDVVNAVRRHFEAETRGLLADPRVALLVEDGRQALLRSPEQFDVIVSDLFVPWHAGTGSLYAREHFETVRSRLRHGGVFAQWLPLYQLGARELEVIARTLLDVFPHVTVWRGDFYAQGPIMALLATTEPLVLDPAALAARVGPLGPELFQRAGAVGADGAGRPSMAAADVEALALATVLPFYAGNLTLARAMLGEGPLNTDDRPVIEFWAPLAGADVAGHRSPWLVGGQLQRFFDRLHQAAPPASDPFLARLTPDARQYATAGLHYYGAIVKAVAGDDAGARDALGQALGLLPADLPVEGPFMTMEHLTGG